jgi:hypothetical protein
LGKNKKEPVDGRVKPGHDEWEGCPGSNKTVLDRTLSRTHPAAAEGHEKARMKAFRDAYDRLEARVKLLVALPIETLDRLTAKDRLEEIQRTQTARER